MKGTKRVRIRTNVKQVYVKDEDGRMLTEQSEE